MMMAHDSTPGRPALSAASVQLLEAALRAFTTSGEDASLRTALHAVSQEARAQQMRAEQLLVALKDVWYSLPQIKDAGEGEREHRLLQRVVTLCIREYYGG